MTANNHHRLKYIIQILHCFKTYLIIKQFDFYVWIRSTGDIHLLQFASLQHGNYEKIHLLGYTNHISIILSNISAINFNNLFYIYLLVFRRMARISETGIDHPSTGYFHHRRQPNPSIPLQALPSPQNSRAVEIHL